MGISRVLKFALMKTIAGLVIPMKTQPPQTTMENLQLSMPMEV